MIRRVVSLIGTASPRPIPATAVLTPTTRPRASTSAPPELPGLSAASVWMTFSTMRVAEPARVGSDRPSALTTPAVTDPAKPIGLPSATTSWPTRSTSASPRTAGCRSRPVARITARSDNASAPTTSVSISRPSVNAASPPSAPAITCADVSMKPSAVITTAEPAPAPRLPSRDRFVTRRLATAGSTCSATDVTIREYASSASNSAGEPPFVRSCVSLIFVSLSRLGAGRTYFFDVRQRFAELAQPVRFVLRDEPHAPAERVAARARDAGADQRIEHVALRHAQARHYRHGMRGERLAHVAAGRAPGHEPSEPT